MCFIKVTSYLSSSCQTEYRPIFGSLQPSACNHITPVMIISITAPTMNLLNENPSDSELVITLQKALLCCIFTSLFLCLTATVMFPPNFECRANKQSQIWCKFCTQQKINHPSRSCYNILQASFLRCCTFHYHLFLCFCCAVSAVPRKRSHTV